MRKLSAAIVYFYVVMTALGLITLGIALMLLPLTAVIFFRHTQYSDYRSYFEGLSIVLSGGMLLWGIHSQDALDRTVEVEEPEMQRTYYLPANALILPDEKGAMVA